MKIRLLSLFITGIAAQATVAAPKAVTEVTPHNLLFIGNSFCDYHVLPAQVAAMLRIKSDGQVTCKRETKGGMSWEGHWEQGKARSRIDAEKWDLVVLQNHSRSPIEERGKFDDYGVRFLNLLKEKKIPAVLYMTWAQRDRPLDQAAITEAYSTLGNLEKVPVAPVGLAFENWIKANPGVPLHIDKDQKHPTMAGSYLAACVLYSTITGESPIGMPEKIEGANWVTHGNLLADLDPTTARKLQETAWITVQTYDAAKYARAEFPPAESSSGPGAADAAGPGEQ